MTVQAAASTAVQNKLWKRDVIGHSRPTWSRSHVAARIGRAPARKQQESMPGSETTSSVSGCGRIIGLKITNSKGMLSGRNRILGPGRNDIIVTTGLEPQQSRCRLTRRKRACRASARWNIGHDFAMVKESGDGLYASLNSAVQQSTQAIQDDTEQARHWFAAIRHQ